MCATKMKQLPGIEDANNQKLANPFQGQGVQSPKKVVQPFQAVAHKFEKSVQ